MLCTKAPALLNSLDGILTLNYRKPKYPPAYDPVKYNLVIVWDILMQDYRAVNMRYCNLIAKVPANQEFWDYYRKELVRMSAGMKMHWMDI